MAKNSVVKKQSLESTYGSVGTPCAVWSPAMKRIAMLLWVSFYKILRRRNISLLRNSEYLLYKTSILLKGGVYNAEEKN